jgi:Mn-dependent DtxR family transcriptional regulator
MVEAQDQDGQRTISTKDVAGRMGYMPATVTEHERHQNGMTLITTSDDPDENIEIYDDGRAPHRSGETPEWSEGE